MKRNEADIGLGKTKTTSAASGSSNESDKTGLRERTSIRRDVTKGSSTGSSDGAKRVASHDDSPPSGAQPLPQEAQGVDWLREMLPVDFSIDQGSVILGNDATPMVLIGDFKRSSGSIAVTEVSDPPPHVFA